jgi:imidazolonepropionase-like amidohydrolase
MKALHWVIAGCAIALGLLLWLTPVPTPGGSKPAKPAPAREFAITDVRLFDGENVWATADVIVRDGLIVEVAESLDIPSSLAVIDGRGKTLLPGLIDSHVHTWGDARRQMLRFGVTTALDMFTDPAQLAGFKSDRESLTASDLADIWSAGALVTAKGGHGTQFGMAIDTYDDVSQAAAIVRSRIEQGSDYIKLVVDDGHAYGDAIDLPTLDVERYQAIITAAHDAQRMAIVHVAKVDDGLAVVDAGADGLVHVFSDRVASVSEVSRIAARDAFVIPTLSVVSGLSGTPSGSELVTDSALQPWLEASQRDSLQTQFPPQYQRASHFANGLANVAALHRAGVAILAGTDAGNPGTAQGASLHGELALLVQSGLTPAEALRAATALPAIRFDLKDRGRIAPGMRADLVLVDGDPTREIAATRKIVTIWKNGAPVDRSLTPADPTQTAIAPKLPPLVSRFDDGLAASNDQVWMVSTDSFMGGSSTAVLRFSKSDSNGAMQVSGTLGKGAPYPWAGAMLMLDATPMSAVDASALSALSFRLKSDGRALNVMLLAGEQGSTPNMLQIQSTTRWQTYRFPLADFAGADIARLRAVVITASLPVGDFAFELDDFEIN